MGETVASFWARVLKDIEEVKEKIENIEDEIRDLELD